MIGFTKKYKERIAAWEKVCSEQAAELGAKELFYQNRVNTLNRDKEELNRQLQVKDARFKQIWEIHTDASLTEHGRSEAMAKVVAKWVLDGVLDLYATTGMVMHKEREVTGAKL
jgi:hypothetical protein